MSKLPKAPLLEVIFELRWNITNQDDLAKYQYLPGDLYSLLKDKYPNREPLASPEIPADILIGRPVHRFRREKNGYPLFQVGPGMISLNTTDVNYSWEEYADWANELIEAFFETYQITTGEKFTPILSYYDFFKMPNTDFLEFVNSMLNIDIQQSFYKTSSPPIDLNIRFAYETEFGQFSVSINEGKNVQKESGLVSKIRLQGTLIEANLKSLIDWLHESHKICSDAFKELTKGELYESFQ